MNKELELLIKINTLTDVQLQLAREIEQLSKQLKLMTEKKA